MESTLIQLTGTFSIDIVSSDFHPGYQFCRSNRKWMTIIKSELKSKTKIWIFRVNDNRFQFMISQVTGRRDIEYVEQIFYAATFDIRNKKLIKQNVFVSYVMYLSSLGVLIDRYRQKKFYETFNFYPIFHDENWFLGAFHWFISGDQFISKSNEELQFDKNEFVLKNSSFDMESHSEETPYLSKVHWIVRIPYSSVFLTFFRNVLIHNNRN